MIPLKNSYKLLLVVLVFLLVSSSTAYSSVYDSVAEELYTGALFRGSDLGYELDRSPTRAEASVLLVRLLGAEEEAVSQFSSGAVAHPFGDVAVWADPYVAWLYQNGLTKGISETEFGADTPCSARMYCVFLLRALGYSDAPDGDFSYDNAIQFAQENGLCDAAMPEIPFYRDQAAALSYQALATDLKDTETCLLESLVDQGAVSAELAQPLLDTISAYRSYSAACAAWKDIRILDMTVDSTVEMQLPDSETTIPLTSSSSVKTVISGSDVKLEASTVSNDGSGDLSVSQWISERYLYTDDGNKQVKLALDYSQMLEQTANLPYCADLFSCMLYDIDSISATKTGNGILYSIVFNRQVSDHMKAVLDCIQTGEISNLEISNLRFEILAGKKGTLSTVRLLYDCALERNAEDGPAAIQYQYDTLCTIQAMDDDVTIDYPDLSGFTEAGSDSEPSLAGEVFAPREYQTYTSQPYDTLSKIAAEYNLSWQELYEENAEVIGPNPNILIPETILLIPEAGDHYLENFSPEQLVTYFQQKLTNYIRDTGRIYYEDTLSDRYVAYKISNPDLSWDNVMTRVNIGLDTPVYTDMNLLSEEEAGSMTILVNKYNQLPSDYKPDDLVQAAWGDNYLRQDAKDALDALSEFMRDAGYPLTVISCYRDYDLQGQIYSKPTSNDTNVAHPGTSEHQLGLAVDVGSGTELYALLAENAHRFGFIIRYPEGKEAVTGYIHEPWHLRYLGSVELATAVTESGLSYDEFYVRYLKPIDKLIAQESPALDHLTPEEKIDLALDIEQNYLTYNQVLETYVQSDETEDGDSAEETCSLFDEIAVLLHFDALSKTLRYGAN
jgi:LysM repeat protein